jgi:DNA-directed RNA polymerase subunit K/omega
MKHIDEAIDLSGVNCYILVHAVAKRAKHIKDMTQPDTEKSMKPVLQALREVVQEEIISHQVPARR